VNQRLMAIFRKEVWHILRDWQSLLIILAMPVFMMFLYGYAVDVNISDVPVVVEDPSPTPESGLLIRAIDQSSLLKVVSVVKAVGDPIQFFRGSAVRAVIRISPSFAADLRRNGNPAAIQVMIDGSDQNLGTILRNAMEPFLQKVTLDILHRQVPLTVTVRQTILYNPGQKAAQFFVPGLVALILIMISALLTSLTITREKEHGTLEQLLISPVRPAEILIGKLAPYLILAAIDGALILLVGRFVFDVHIAGSLLLLMLASVVYIFVALSAGLLVSTVVKRQEHAMMAVMPPTMLPTVMLSGFIFPIASMPLFLQWISAAVPPTYYLSIIRGIILKGVGLEVLWSQFLILSLMGLFLIIVSIRAFRVKL
jgi:ABC-2 type transport system permease protein